MINLLIILYYSHNQFLKFTLFKYSPCIVSQLIRNKLANQKIRKILV